MNVPPGSEHAVHCLSLPAEGGRAGISGKAGLMGKGGQKGSLDDANIEAENGKDGLSGKESTIIPKDGKQRKAPDIFVNEVLSIKNINLKTEQKW